MVFVSSSCIRANSVMDSIDALSHITKNIELSGGSSYQCDDLLDSLMTYSKDEFNFLIHGYFPPPKEHFLLNFADTSEMTREFISKSAEFTSKLCVPYYSTHAGFASDFTIDKNEHLVGGYNTFGMDGIAKNVEWFYETFPSLDLALENLYPNNKDAECCFWMRPECIDEQMQKDGRLNLLLDFGHMKISADYFSFDWVKACEFLMDKYSDRIKEIHVSENEGVKDEHFPVLEDSIQLCILKNFATEINLNGINVTLEARHASLDEIAKSYDLIQTTLKDKNEF